MITVKLPILKKHKTLKWLHFIAREVVSGFGAAFVFMIIILSSIMSSIVSSMKDIFSDKDIISSILDGSLWNTILDGYLRDIFDGSLWIMAFALSLATYFGIRFLFPSPYKKVVVELPEGVSKDTFKIFIEACTDNLALLRRDAASIHKLPFRSAVLHLCHLGDDLLVNFEKDPKDVQVAHALPDRLQRLHEILTGYLELAQQRSQSPQTLRAMKDSEKAVIKAVAKFEELHHRVLENDALDLSTNAKTLDNLLDFD